MKISILAPVLVNEISIESIFNNGFLSKLRLSPFSDNSIYFFSELSKRILDSDNIKSFPELVALAYWLRKANLYSIINDFKRGIYNNEILTPRGTAFHVAPSNVDSIFIYSWALSLLAGNSNIVRVTQNMNPQLELLLKIIRELMVDSRWNEISERNLIITYPRDDEINKYISAVADLRIIWGGDETINNIRSLPSKPTTKDISFADKFSYTVINCSEYMNLDDSGKLKLANYFFNDSYWFNQMACSSPRFVFFTGDQYKCQVASKIFWEYLQNELAIKGLADSIEIAMEKLVYLYESFTLSGNAFSSVKINKNNPTVARIGIDEIRQFNETCGGGFFFECFIENIFDLKKIITHKDQTLSYFGFNMDLLKEFVNEVNGAGIDRVVPIGQALNFSPTWDGFYLLSELTKRVSIIR